MKLNKLLKNFAVAGVLISAPLYPNTIKDPMDLNIWYKNSGFYYQREALNEDGTRQDIWKTPEQTVKDKGGDCEDFAILSKRVLTDLGYTAYIIALYGKDGGHGICLFKEKDGTYGVMDVLHYMKYKNNNWKEFISKLYSNYDRVYVCLEDGLCQHLFNIEKDGK